MTTRLGIIGYGIMGERLLGAALQHDPGTIAVAGVWDPSPAAMERLAATHPAVIRLGSAQALLAACDCVYVASPPASHIAHLQAALEAGRAVLCEKPLAVDAAAARGLVEHAEASGARAAVQFPFASSLAVDQLKAWIAEGHVGKVRELTIEVAFAAWPRPWQADATRWLDGRAEGGFTREVVSHFLFLARRLLGSLVLEGSRVEYLQADRSERRIEAQLQVGSVPVRLTGAVGVTDKADHNLWTLTGEAGAIRLRDWSIAERLENGQWTEAADAIANEAARPLVLRRQLDKFAALTRGEPQDLATLREALDVQEVVEAILRG